MQRLCMTGLGFSRSHLNASCLLSQSQAAESVKRAVQHNPLGLQLLSAMWLEA